MEFVRGADIPLSGGDWGLRYLLHGPNVEIGVLVMKPGQSSKDYGHHHHEEVEETFVFITGSGQLEVAGEVLDVQAGDAVRVDPNDRHFLSNTGDEPMEILFVKYPYSPEDRVEE